MTPFIIAAILVFILIALVYADKKKIKTKAEAGIKFNPLPAPPKPHNPPKPYNPCAAANKASDALDAEIDDLIGLAPTKETGRTVPTARREKDRFITVDEIRHTAYLIAAGDNFQKSPSHYWCEAEKQLKEQV